MPNYVYKKPEVNDEEYPEAIRRKIKFADSINTEYKLSDADIRLIEFERYKRTFPDTLTVFIASLRKVKHSNKVLKAERERDSNNEWFIYKIIEEIKDKDKRAHTHERWIGFHTEPIAEVKTNNLDEVTDVVVEKEQIVYDIPFSRKVVEEMINLPKVVNTPSDIALGMGEDSGLDSQDPVRLPLLSVFNLEEFIQFRYDSLEGANKDGYLVPSYGGVIEFLIKKGIRPEDAMYPGEKIPEAFREMVEQQREDQQQSLQQEEQQLVKSKYKQTEARQKAQT